MATVRVDLVVEAKGEASIKSTATALDGVGNAAKRADQALNSWTSTQQRAAQKMERLQEEAIKMNTGFSSSDDRAQLFSATLGKATSIVGGYEKSILQLGDAFGVPLGPLGALTSATDVAGLGFSQMTKSAVGFNAGSVAVVGAGLAIGGAIGTMIVKLTDGEKEFEAIAAAALNFFGLLEKSTGPATTNVTEMGKIQQQVQQNVINLMRSQGKTTEEITAQLTGKYVPALDNVVDGLRKEEEARKKAADAAKKHAEELKKQAEAYAKLAPFMPAFVKGLELQALMAGSAARAYAELGKQIKPVTDLQIRNSAEAHAQGVALAELDMVIDKTLGFWTRYPDVVKQELENASGEVEEHVETTEEHFDKLADKAHEVASIFGATGDLFVALGADADSTFVKLLDGFAGLADAAGNVFSNLAKGNILGAVAAGIGGIAGFIGGLFGHAKKAREEMEKLRAEFIADRGGLRELQAAAEKAGISLKALFDARTADALKKAIDDIGRGIDLWAEATKKTQEAMDRYGITVDQMGEKWAQQHLDEQAMQLYQDYMLLTAAGADHNLVIQKMAPSINEYVQTALKAGSTIPESMRPIIEAMIEQGLLLDENGVAYKSAEEAGITYALSTSEAMKLLIEKIDELVSALLGIPTNINTNVNTDYTTTGTPPGGDSYDHSYAAGTHGPKRLSRDMIFRAHKGEMVWVIPEHEARAMEYMSAAKGYGREGEEFERSRFPDRGGYSPEAEAPGEGWGGGGGGGGGRERGRRRRFEEAGPSPAEVAQHVADKVAEVFRREVAAKPQVVLQPQTNVTIEDKSLVRTARGVAEFNEHVVAGIVTHLKRRDSKLIDALAEVVKK